MLQINFRVEMGNLSGPSVGAIIVLILALIITVVSLATNHWGDYDVRTQFGVSIHILQTIYACCMHVDQYLNNICHIVHIRLVSILDSNLSQGIDKVLC